MAEKKRRGKREHLKDFYKDVSGKYVYGGALYTCNLPDAERKRNLRQMWFCCGSAFVALIVAGCIPAAGMAEGFLVLPFYLGTIISVGMVCWALWELCDGGDPMREYVYNASVEKMPRRCEFGMVLGGLCLGGLVIHLMFSGLKDAELWATVFFVAIQFWTVIGMTFVKKLLKRMKWTKK